MSRPLRSTPITRASSLLRDGPPAGVATVLSPHGVCRSDAPSRPANLQPGHYPHPPSHVPYESRRPRSRRLYAGHRLANTWAPARLILDSGTQPGSDVIFKISTRQQPVVSPIPT